MAQPYYDSDEEDPPVGFEQDPDSDDIGDGWFTYSDGRREYSYSPQEAQRLDREGKAKLLSDAGAKLAGEDGSRKPVAAPEKPATREDSQRAAASLAGEGASEDERFLRSETGAEQEDRVAAEAPQVAPSQPPLEAPKMPGARGPARYTDTSGMSQSRGASQSASSSESVTRSAMPKEEFDRFQRESSEAYDRMVDTVDQNSRQEALQLRERAEQMMQAGRDREAAVAGAQAQRDQRAMQTVTKMKEVGARPIDNDKIWKDKGVFGTLMGFLGVAAGSAYATKHGGPNTALQTINEQRQQAIKSQMEDRDSELRTLEKELGSLDAAVPVLEARMNKALEEQVQANLVGEKSQMALRNGRDLIAKLQAERVKLMGDAAKAYHGTLAKQQSMGSQLTEQQSVEQGQSRVSGAGIGEGPAGKTQAQVYDELLERDKKMEERGVPKEERAKMWAGHGFQAPSGESAPARTDREQREKIERDEAAFTEAEGKAESAYQSFGQYGEAFGLTRDPKTGKLVAPDGVRGLQSPAYQEKIPGAFGFATPIEDARTAALEGLGRLQSGGAITADEEKRFTEILGDDDITRDQLASKLNALETLINTRRKANRREAPKGIPSSWKSKPAEGAQ